MKDLEILLADRNTKAEAERRMKERSYIIYDAAGFEENEMMEWLEDYDPEDRAETADAFRQMITEGMPTITDWSVCDHDGTRYLIAYQN